MTELECPFHAQEQKEGSSHLSITIITLRMENKKDPHHTQLLLRFHILKDTSTERIWFFPVVPRNLHEKDLGTEPVKEACVWRGKGSDGSAVRQESES